MKAKARLNLLETVLRILAGGVGLIFLLIGIGFLTLPEVFANGFFAEPARAVGINSIRGDFGALFLGMCFFCLLGTLTEHRRLLAVPIVFLVLVVAGRLTSLITDDVPMVMADSILAELTFILILVSALISFSAKQQIPAGTRGFRQFFSYRVMAAIAVVIILTAGIFTAQKQIGMKMLKVIASRFTAMDVIGDLPDGLHVGIAGAGAPLPDAKRVGPCLFVIAGKKLFVVDAGPGGVRQMELMKLPLGRVKAVLLTHFHSDHIGDLGELMLKRWAGGANNEPLDVFGPEGVETVVKGFNLAYSIDSGYRVSHHGPETTPPGGAGGTAKTFDFPAGKQEKVIIDEAGVKVTAFPVDHRPVKPAVGYRFDYKGRSLVISGDSLPSESLRRRAGGADLLIHDALQPAMVRVLSRLNKEGDRGNLAAITTDILDYHAFPEEAARIAEETGVNHLVLYHMLPPLPVSALHAAFLGKSKKYYQGPITIGTDGMLFSLPAGKSKIFKKWLL